MLRRTIDFSYHILSHQIAFLMLFTLHEIEIDSQTIFLIFLNLEYIAQLLIYTLIFHKTDPRLQWQRHLDLLD
ncbi:hypothetical protein BGZ57DRAFT_902264 [Hyaloscypha finlandica]|nr:hypothetical protein BGZ57DRAFT_902264 [Hyaloscypha finlandica]